MFWTEGWLYHLALIANRRLSNYKYPLLNGLELGQMSLSCFGYFEIEKGEIFIFGSIFRQERMVHSCLTSSYLVPGEGESWFPNIERGCFFRVLKNGVEQRRYQRRAKEKGVETLSMSLCEEEGEREKMGDLYLMRIHRHKNKRESNTTKKSYIYSFSFFPPPCILMTEGVWILKFQKSASYLTSYQNLSLIA